MDQDSLEKIIGDVAGGSLSPEDAVQKIQGTAPTHETLLDIPVVDSQVNKATIAATGPNPDAPTRILLKQTPGDDGSGYRILKEHARGGMGRVMLALDLKVGRKVALKELLSGSSSSLSNTGRETSSIGERFLREARVTGRLEHPNIVPVYEIGEGENGQFYTMRFVEGKTLAERLDEIAHIQNDKQRVASRLQLLDAFCDVCNAIAYAHSKGVIHRDLKPANIMLGEFGETVVLDWGLARVEGDEDVAPMASVVIDSQNDSAQLTLDGTVLGTPAYMPPEQARGELKNVDELSDVYSLGATLYEILCGRPPYSGSNPRAVVREVTESAPTPVSQIEASLPAELAALCAHAMDRSRDTRLGSALTLAQEVKAFRDGRTLQSYEYSSAELLKRFLKRQWKLVAVAVLAVIAIAVVTSYAVNQIVDERNTAQTALNKAEAEEKKRLEAEELVAQKARETLASRQSAIKRVESTLAEYDAVTMLRDLYSRVDAYRNGPEKLQVKAAERESNSVLLTTVLGYVSQLQELVRLRTVGVDLEGADNQRSDLEMIQKSLVHLAIYNLDFELARYVLSSSNLRDHAINELNRESDAREVRVLDWRAQRVVACFDDSRLGLRRPERSDAKPSLNDYVAEFAEFQDDQTIRMLGSELEQLSLRTRQESRAIGVIEYDLAHLLCSSLGKIRKPTATVPLLASFLKSQTHPRLIRAAASALAATQHPLGTSALIEAWQQRDFLFVEDNKDCFLSAFTTPRDSVNFKGLRLFLTDRFDDASQVLSSDSNRHGQVILALALGQSSDSDQKANAIKIVDELIVKFPNVAVHHIAKARLTAPNLALPHYNTAVELVPDSSRVLLERGRFCRHIHQDQANADAKTLTERWPFVVEHWQLLGDTGRDRSQFESAELAYERAVEVDPDYADAWTGYGVTLKALFRKPGQCRDALATAIRLDSQQSHALSHLSQLEFHKRDFEKSIELANRSVAINPLEQDAWYYLALAYLRLQDGGVTSLEVINARADNPFERANMEKAVVAFNGLVASSPQNYRGWALMATTLTALGRDAEALKAIAAADRLSFLEANTVEMGTLLLREAEALIHARNRLVEDPSNADELLDTARVLAYDAYHSSEMAVTRKRLRGAVSALADAENLLGDSRTLGHKKAIRHVRRSIAQAMRRAKFFHAIEAVLLPVAASEPIWNSAHDEFSRAEATIGLSTQYRTDTVLFLGESEEEQLQLESKINDLTGHQRKKQADEMLEAGLNMILAITRKGYEPPNGASTTATEPYTKHPTFGKVAGVILQNRESGIWPKLHPYSVLVIGSVAEDGQATELGIKQFDVIHRINGHFPKGPKEAIRILQSIETGSYEMLLRRYERGDDGNPVQLQDANGKLVFDERGNPEFKFKEFVTHPKVGYLGITLETGHLPHPMDS
ncbi:protein kinase [Planctomycetota bacterium]|nr:protein kinase [Planctomycetota bacterium]